jgi:hypothetical protein
LQHGSGSILSDFVNTTTKENLKKIAISFGDNISVAKENVQIINL